MKKKTVALFLTLSLVLSAALTGCGDSGGESGSTPENSGESSQVSAGDSGDGSSSDAGEEGSQPGEAENDREEITVTMMVTEPVTQELPDSFPLLDAVKEKFNINLELTIVPGADYGTKKSTVLGTANLPDVICGMTVDEVKQYGGTDGMFLNLDEYKSYAPDYFGLVDGGDRAIETNKMRVNGNLYCFEKLEKYRVAIAPLVGIRMDLLEEQNIAVPTTFDEYYDALLKIKEAHPEMYGFSTRNGTNYLIGSFAYSMGTGGFPTFNTARGMYLEPGTDSYIYGPTDEKFTRVIEFLRKAYADGILHPDYANMDKDTMFEKLSNGELISVCDNNSFISRTFNPALQQIEPDAYFDILEPLKNQDGNIRAYRYNKDWTDNVAVISSQTEHPERIVEMMNWLYTEEGSLLSNFGVEGVHYDMVDGVPTIKQELIDECAGADDITSAVLGKLGAGLLGMAFYVDETFSAQVSDPIYMDQAERIDSWTEAGELTFLPNWLSFTEEEQERVTEIEQNLSNIFNQEIDAFITGKKSMDEWTNLVESLKGAGSEELEGIFNTAYDRIK